MTEPYQLNEAELEAIELAKTADKPFSSDHVEDLKTDIKNHYRTEQNEECCYCRKNMIGEFRMVLDIEHILPQSSYPEYRFEPVNLSVACKRCNMNIKGRKIDFFNGTKANVGGHFVSTSYWFLHPILDDFYDHLDYEVEMNRTRKLIAYTILNNSLKGEYHYRYFKLEHLEIDSVNVSQGLKSVEEQISDFDPEVAEKLIEIRDQELD